MVIDFSLHHRYTIEAVLCIKQEIKPELRGAKTKGFLYKQSMYNMESYFR